MGGRVISWQFRRALPLALGVGGPVGSPAGHGATLPDARAYELFQHYCAYGFASQFKLYKLYTRAAAFTPQH
jgi:hypothetical protein